MTYEDALKIGSKIDGYVKCTFALIYGNGVKFSIQARNYAYDAGGYGTWQENANKYFEGETDQMVVPTPYAPPGPEGASPSGRDYGSNYHEYGLDAEYNFRLILEVPILTAALEEKQKDGYIPVKLTAEAARLIAQLAHRHQRNKYYVYRVYDKDHYVEGNLRHKPGDRTLVLETYKKPNMDDPGYAPVYEPGYTPHNSINPEIDKKYTRWHYELVTGVADSESYTWLQEACADYKNAIWYVKPGAIDWIPTKIDNVTITDANGVEIKLDDAIEAARRKVESAKNVLIAAGAASLII